MSFDAIVAGAGIWGCTVARCLADAGKKVLVLEKRSVVGGNVRCNIDPETNIEIHNYGSHIFHTQIPEVWEFVNRFVNFNGYQHKALAHYRGRNYYLPLGLSLINKFFSVELKPCDVEDFMRDESHASAIFDAFFRGYTSKQWGRAPEDIDPTVIKRIPVRSNYDVNYFNDYWQGIPSEGYNVLFDRLLDHPNIEVQCNTNFRIEDFSKHVGVKIYYSGPIDALFGYKFGALPWRTLRFETEVLDETDYQGTSQVNYPEVDVPYTRVHEFKHYHPEPVGPLSQSASLKSGKKTIIMREYSATWQLGDEPYYPINNEESAALLAKYNEEAALYKDLVIGGRLGQYKYFDMDKSIQTALNTVKEGAL